MIYILDTVSLGFFEQRHPATLRRMQEVLAEGGNQVVTTIVTVEERLDGWLLECRKAQTAPRVSLGTAVKTRSPLDFRI